MRSRKRCLIRAISASGQATLEELRGGDAVANAAVVRAVLGGAPGPARDAALLNAAAGLVAFDLDAVGPLAERMAAALKRRRAIH